MHDELRVSAVLDRHWSAWVDGLEVSSDERGQTTIAGWPGSAWRWCCCSSAARGRRRRSGSRPSRFPSRTTKEQTVRRPTSSQVHTSNEHQSKEKERWEGSS